MAERWMERKFDGIDTIPMFEPPDNGKKPEGKRKPTRSVDRDCCPDCGQDVGLYVQAVHEYRRVLAYRRHWRYRRSGSAFICPRSDTEAARPEGAAL